MFRKHTPETKLKISESLIGNTRTKGHKLTDEHREKIRISGIGRIPSEETRAKRSAALMGRQITWGEKISASRKGQTNWPVGLRHTDEARTKIKNEKRLHAALDIECGCWVHSRKNNPSKLAWKAYGLFLKDFEVVIPEARFGPYSVDFLLAEEWLGIEVDGDYWHKDRDHTERDSYLLREHGLPIARLSQQEIVDWNVGI